LVNCKFRKKLTLVFEILLVFVFCRIHIHIKVDIHVHIYVLYRVEVSWQSSLYQVIKSLFLNRRFSSSLAARRQLDKVLNHRVLREL